jgi:hypothetical protein
MLGSGHAMPCLSGLLSVLQVYAKPLSISTSRDVDQSRVPEAYLALTSVCAINMGLFLGPLLSRVRARLPVLPSVFSLVEWIRLRQRLWNPASTNFQQTTALDPRGRAMRAAVEKSNVSGKALVPVSGAEIRYSIAAGTIRSRKKAQNHGSVFEASLLRRQIICQHP